MKRLRAWLVYWRGRRWMRSGYCPACYSSPPDPSCSVCAGHHQYGYDLHPMTAATWRLIWDRMHGRTTL